MTGNPNHDDKGKFAAGSGAKAGYTEAKAFKEKLDTHVTALSKTLGNFPRGAMGMTPDSVKASAEFKKVKAEFDGAFAKLRDFNEKFHKVYKSEIKSDRKR
jgi:hypothetical protein